jgi:Ca2+-binding RTX toxin-like protein
MPEALSHSPVVRDGNTLWLVGGFVGDHPGPSTTHVWKYDTASDTWSQGPPLPQPRGAGGAAIVGRTIHFFGGVNRPAGKNIYVDEAEHWALDLDAPNPSWQERAPLPNPRNHMTSAALNGKVYAIGGQHGNNENAGNQAEVDVYDPQTDSWNRAADLPEARGHAVALVMNGRIIVLGGALNGNLKSADVAEYDPASDAWKRLPKLPAARMTPVADAVGDKIIVSTGNGSGPEEETWTALNPAPGTGGECTITGTSANNTLTGTAGADTICAGGGNDTIKGLGGNDTLKGEAGGDKLFGGTGDDTLDGGLGNDTANFSGSLAAVTASLTSGTATGEGSDTLSSVEYLIGSSYGDNLTGNDGINNLKGGGGNDTLGGSGGNDILDGGGGNDTDRGGSGNDSVKGSSGADSLFGDEGGDSLNSQDGVSGNDTLDGGLDTDTCVTDATEKSIENCEQ